MSLKKEGLKPALIQLGQTLSTLYIAATTLYAAFGAILFFDLLQVIHRWLALLASSSGQATTITATSTTDIKSISVDINSMTINLCDQIEKDNNGAKLLSVWSETDHHNLTKLVAQIDLFLTSARQLLKIFQYGPKYHSNNRAHCSCIVM